jgi:hypothetical protein
MKSLKLKQVCRGGGGAMVSPQHPMAKVGDSGGVVTYEVTDIPDDVPVSEVVRKFNGTATICAEMRGRYTYRFDELGIGNIIMI